MKLHKKRWMWRVSGEKKQQFRETERKESEKKHGPDPVAFKQTETLTELTFFCFRQLTKLPLSFLLTAMTKAFLNSG